MSRIVSRSEISQLNMAAMTALAEERVEEYLELALEAFRAENVRNSMVRSLLTAEDTMIPTDISRRILRDYGVFVSAIQINNALCALGYQTRSRVYGHFGEMRYEVTDTTVNFALGCTERTKPEITRVRWNVEIVDILAEHFGIENVDGQNQQS